MRATSRGRKPRELFESALSTAQSYDPRAAEYLRRADSSTLDALQLDDEEEMRYTLKTLGAGFWALLNAEDYESGIRAVIECGGDADTNAAVAGALLGARFGLEGIPTRLLDGLNWYRILSESATKLITLMDSQRKEEGVDP